ncbi:MAG: helix-turn-helix transcriptional regulator [Cellulosilyticaceae bacterium]
MQINRLFEIVYRLISAEKISARELAEQFEVSTRTIYRDVEILSSAGIPIFMTKGKGGGIGLLPGFVLNKTMLTSDEKANILAALESLRTVDETSLDKLLKKLGILFGEQNKGFIQIDYSDWGQRIKEQFEKSKEAILSHKLLVFDYVSATSKVTSRQVEPYILLYKDRNWYLKCFCLDKQAFRLFRLSRMRNMKISEVRYIPREEKTDMKIIQPKAVLTEIKMIISKEQMHRVLDEFHPKNVVKNTDGNYRVTMNFVEDEWVYGYILSFGCSATVLEPPHIRQLIKERLMKSLDNYV